MTSLWKDRLLRPFGFAIAAALAAHVLEAVFALVADNALLHSAMSDGARLRYLVMVVLAFVLPAAAGGVAALPLALKKPRLAAALAAFIGAGLPAIEALRHADIRGTIVVPFGVCALIVAMVGVAVALLGPGPSLERQSTGAPAPRTRRAMPLVFAAACALLVVLMATASTQSADPIAENNAMALESLTVAPAAGEAGDPPVPKFKNLLVLLVDTLRADHLGCYGYPRRTSPNIDAFAAEGVLFENAAAPKPKTSPAVASLFTGTWPQTHRVTQTSTVLPLEQTTLAETLSDAGFATFAVAANVNVSEFFSFDQGFDEFVSVQRIKDERRFVEKHAGRVRDVLLDWLEQRGDERWFAYAHFIDPHSKYQPPEGYPERFRGDALDGILGTHDLPVIADEYEGCINRAVYLSDAGGNLDEYVVRYDGEIAFVDEVIADTLAALDRHGLAEDTVVVFTADHGESITEHGTLFNHGYHPYEEQVHIPLAIRGHGLARGQRRGEQVSLVGLMPTLLTLVGVPAPPRVEEESFARLLLEGTPPGQGTPTFMSARASKRARVTGVRTNRWKYLERLEGVSPEQAVTWENLLLPGKRFAFDLAENRDSHLHVELYDLQADPKELNNLAFELHGEREQFARLLAWHRARAAPFGPKPEVLDRKKLKKEVSEELEQMGYLGAGS